MFKRRGMFVCGAGGASLFWSARILSTGLLVIGLGLLFQPDRFSATPSYGNLLVLLPAQIWGGFYVAVALALWLWTTIAPRKRGWAAAAHVPALALIAGWLMAFVVRYLTDSDTTIVNVVMWSIVLAGLVRSLAVAYRLGDR